MNQRARGPIRVDGYTVFVPMTRGLETLVSLCDLAKVDGALWRVSGHKKYVVGRPVGMAAPILLHRFIMDAPDGVVVDHINLDKLDNRRENLRVCSAFENSRNIGKRRPAEGSAHTSDFKGVHWCKSTLKFRAYLYRAGERHFLGVYSDQVDAARAYDDAAKRLFGSFARLNFPA